MNVTRKSLGMKLVISLFLIIFLFNTVVTNYSYGGWNVEGILFKPFCVWAGEILISINSIMASILGGADDLVDAIIEMKDSGDLPLAWYNYLASPERIFSGAYPILDANIFNASESSGTQVLSDTVMYGFGTETISSVKKAVSKIYYSLIGMCGVALLSLLIYVGIRIILSSNSPQEQGKWKMYLIDWFKAVCLLFFAHVIMITIFFIVDLVMDAFIEFTGDRSIVSFCAQEVMLDTWNFEFGKEFIYLMVFGYVTWLTIVFIVSYFKRMIWTIVLIVIAPIVAVVYPLSGKVYNGKAVFDKWIREFVINAIIPVFHIIVYTVLVQIPLSTVSTNTENLICGYSFTNLFTILYCIIAMSLIKPAEKFIRELFGVKGNVASMTSYESGSQTISAAMKTAIDVGAAVATGGTTAGLAMMAKEKFGVNIENDEQGESTNKSYNEEMLDAYDESYGTQDWDPWERQSMVEDLYSGNKKEPISDEELKGLLREDGWSEEDIKEYLDESGSQENKDISNSTVIGLLEEIRDNTAGKNSSNNNNINNDENQNPNEEYSGIKLEDIPLQEDKNKDENKKESIKDKLRDGAEKKNNKIKNSNISTAYTALRNSPEFQEKLMNLRSSLHELSDSMAMPEFQSNDWQNSAFSQIARLNIEKKRNAMKENEDIHINSKANIDYMIKTNGLQEKYEKMYKYSDGTPNVERAKEAAKEEAKHLLQKTTPYLQYGIKDIGTMNELLKYQKASNCSSEDAIRGYSFQVKDSKEILKVVTQNIVKNNEKIEIGVDKQGKPQYFESANLKNPDTKISDEDLKTIGTYVQGKVVSARQYRDKGYSIDDSIRLSNLEKNIKDKNIKVDKDSSVQDVVIKVDKAIKNGVESGNKYVISSSTKDNINTNTQKNKDLKDLETFINTEIDKNRKLNK